MFGTMGPRISPDAEIRISSLPSIASEGDGREIVSLNVGTWSLRVALRAPTHSKYSTISSAEPYQINRLIESVFLSPWIVTVRFRSIPSKTSAELMDFLLVQSLTGRPNILTEIAKVPPRCVVIEKCSCVSFSAGQAQVILFDSP